MYHNKRIGIFISHIFGSFQTQLCQGIIDTTQEYGYNTDIFTSMDGENISCYTPGENSILKIPNFDEYSGIVFASDTYRSNDLKFSILHTLQKKCTCPVIEVNQKNGNYPAIFLDNNTPAYELTCHLITTHHLTHICYLGNSYEKIFSKKRQDSFLKALDQYHLPVSAHSIYTCGYSSSDISSALDFFLSSKEKPEAIICYNDRMALTLMEILSERKIRVPEDIAITGFDNLDAGSHIVPALTTVTFPIYELGCKTAKQLLLAIEQTTIPEITTVTASTIFKDSCGCKSTHSGSPLTFQQKQEKYIQELESSMIQDLNMSSSFNGITDIDQGMDLLEHFIQQLKCHEIYLCLYSDWDTAPDHILEITDTLDLEDINQNSILLKFAFRDGKRIQECTFRRTQILPDYILDQSSHSYIYTPLFFGNHAFGYLALSFHENQIYYPFSHVSWIMNINSMLQNVCNIQHMGLLTERLEFVSQFDELTGLYNRSVFFQMAPQFIADTLTLSGSITAFAFHLKDLTLINHTHSLQEGDFALQVLGQALKQALEEPNLCGRVGSAEFYVLTNMETDSEAKNFILKVENYLNNYNHLHNKSYTLSVRSSFSLLHEDSSYYFIRSIAIYISIMTHPFLLIWHIIGNFTLVKNSFSIFTIPYSLIFLKMLYHQRIQTYIITIYHNSISSSV